jgi:hypothetical protein
MNAWMYAHACVYVLTIHEAAGQGERGIRDTPIHLPLHSAFSCPRSGPLQFGTMTIVANKEPAQQKSIVNKLITRHNNSPYT